MTFCFFDSCWWGDEPDLDHSAGTYVALVQDGSTQWSCNVDATTALIDPCLLTVTNIGPLLCEVGVTTYDPLTKTATDLLPHEGMADVCVFNQIPNTQVSFSASGSSWGTIGDS